MQMKFSVILPSLLADFPGAATNRNAKLVRAIESVREQTFEDFELIVIADGCGVTEYIVKNKFLQLDSRVNLLSVKRKGLWSNAPRNAGLEAAKGEYITYLDNDDKWGPDHLQIISSHLNGEDWVYSNDHVWNGEEWIERTTDVSQYGRCGTSNICHAAKLGLRWKEAGYGHDYLFIQQLRKFENFKQITPAQYYVCHINGGYCI